MCAAHRKSHSQRKRPSLLSQAVTSVSHSALLGPRVAAPSGPAPVEHERTVQETHLRAERGPLCTTASTTTGSTTLAGDRERCISAHTHSVLFTHGAQHVCSAVHSHVSPRLLCVGPTPLAGRTESVRRPCCAQTSDFHKRLEFPRQRTPGGRLDESNALGEAHGLFVTCWRNCFPRARACLTTVWVCTYFTRIGIQQHRMLLNCHGSSSTRSSSGKRPPCPRPCSGFHSVQAPTRGATYGATMSRTERHSATSSGSVTPL